MILSMGLLLCVAAELLVCVAVRYLSWDRIRSWFQNRTTSATDPDHLRVSVLERLKSGEHRVVYGIFNANTSRFVDGEVATAKEIDPEIAALHNDTPLVVYS